MQIEHCSTCQAIQSRPWLKLDDIGRDKLKTVGQGAATQVFVAVHPDAADKTGLYFDSCRVKEPSKQAQDEALADRLWVETEKIVASL